jgi:hypothetical protein
MFPKVFGFGVAVAAALALLSASSAAVAKVDSAATIDVSTRTAVVHYLRSVRIDPRGVVIERGLRNYAGARCPGRGWTCTTTMHPVVQVAAAGGRNRFRCSTARCAVVQISQLRAAGPNIAICIKTKGLAQACAIRQVSSTANNRAVVYESAPSSKGTTTSTASTMSIKQTTTSSLSITQKATGPVGAPNSNEACVYQAINLARSGAIHKNSVILTQSARQTMTITQDSANGGNSAAASATPHGKCTGSSITQRQTLSSNLTVPRSVTQKQNTATTGANMTIDIEQNQSAGFVGSARGHNSANFNQYNSLTAVANSPAGPVKQTQGALSGGLLGTVNQDSRDPSTVVTTQTGIECVNGAKSGVTTCSTVAGPAPSSVAQAQSTVVRKGVGRATQTGNAADTFVANQSSTQGNNPGPDSYGTSTVQGDCSTAGNCTVTQNTNVDGQQHTNTQGGQNVNIVTGCTSSKCTSVQPAPEFTANAVNGPIETFDLTSGQLLHSFLPNGAIAGSGTAVAVAGNEVFYAEGGNGASDAIHVAPFNGGAGGNDTRTIPNPQPGNGIVTLDYANGTLYVTEQNSDVVWALNPATGAVIGTTSVTDLVLGGEFAVLPDGNFLVEGEGCIYGEYDHITGIYTGHAIQLPGYPKTYDDCEGVATDGASLYFAVGNVDGSESVLWTGLDGTIFANIPHAQSEGITDISIP